MLPLCKIILIQAASETLHQTVIEWMLRQVRPDAQLVFIFILADHFPVSVKDHTAGTCCFLVNEVLYFDVEISPEVG
jgi:hypothetical protein